MKLKRAVIFFLFFAIQSAGYSCKKTNESTEKTNESTDLKKSEASNDIKKSDTPVDYLSTGTSITFDNAEYTLAWSSHPNETFFKQEYLSGGENLESYNEMLLLDVLITDKSVEEIAQSKVTELDQLKASNPFVNYNLFSKDGEYMIDFLVSDKPDTPEIIERNVYRYKSGTNDDGTKYVLMFGVSERAYGNGIDDFLSNLKAVKSDLTNAVASFNIPNITLSK